MTGCLVAGDMNICHKQWLKHSPADSLESERLHLICKEHCLNRIVKGRTRVSNLLDLALSSLRRAAAATVVQVLRTMCVLVTVKLQIPKSLRHPAYSM